MKPVNLSGTSHFSYNAHASANPYGPRKGLQGKLNHLRADLVAKIASIAVRRRAFKRVKLSH
ncbi:MAG: hypothetical protein JWN98_684 [Abditibacteriota bacterium]|nr:hypothetical protein [Abditibacteriota bacterium]